MTELAIDHRYLGTDQPTFVIAEIGVNHDGDEQRALDLVESARRAGADAVKLQVFTATKLMSPEAEFAQYQAERAVDDTPVQMLARYELTGGQLARIVGAIRNAGMLPLATPFSPGDVDTVASLGVAAIKIASPDLVNKVLLRKAACTGLPMLVSTGAADEAEITAAVSWLTTWRVPMALLHCVSAYPTPLDQANLWWIGRLWNFGVPVGYSDHTVEPAAGALAVAAGACVIEKHLTYDKAAAGPDHAASADPAEFAQYVRLIRMAEAMRGPGGPRAVLPIEQDVRRVSRQSVVTTRPLAAGHVIQDNDLTVRRPGTGIPAADVDTLVGTTLARDVATGHLLRETDIARPAPFVLPHAG